jgi:hypothetical protein
MFTINKYKNFIINSHRPKNINIHEFMYLINQPNKYKNISHLEESISLIDCGIFLNYNINLLKKYNSNKFYYEKNLINISNKILFRSMNIYKLEKKFNYKFSIAHAIRAYDMIYGIQIRTIINPIDNTQLRIDIDDIISNSKSKIHEQLQEIDSIMDTKNN